MDEQGGFRAGRGCNDQIFTVRQIMEKTIEKDKVVYMAFVDLEKDYDEVNREKCATQMNVLRRVKGVSRMERIRSEHIRQHLGQESVLDVIRRRQENWKGILNEMNSDRVTKKVYVGEMEGRRLRGRPRMRWSDNFK